MLNAPAADPSVRFRHERRRVSRAGPQAPPWICARCAREFPASRLRELTVHHKDGDHHNNPPDASNWELLCIYCHENEHARVEDDKAGGGAEPSPEPATHRPLAGLGKLIKKA